jgi:polysaccharide deacetylase family protein (PEP-CTERM system associated)
MIPGTTVPVPAGNAMVVNAMTVDVEDWFQVENFKGAIARDNWGHMEHRVEASTGRLLDLLAEAGVRATFFTLGWVAERYGALIRRIVAGGHELASHGHWHDRVVALGPAAFRDDLIQAKRALEDAGGVEVLGYRAPTFSIGTRSTPWAHQILAETGHQYSSSIFPGRHEGRADQALIPYFAPAGVLEIPMTAWRPAVLRGRAVPVSGGGWFRIMPYSGFAAMLRQVNGGEGRRGVFYVHPWEVDPGQPSVPGVSALRRFKHRVGLGSTVPRMRRLLRDFHWDRMDRVFAAEIGRAGDAATPPLSRASESSRSWPEAA